jgi:hypothetical protein
MTEFREAPRNGEEGFAPLVIVATSAFGLGVNRPDVRTVFCVSAPTDLAALYQQLGRAGRDAAGKDITGADLIGTTELTMSAPTDDGGTCAPGVAERPANVGLALLTSRGLRTVAFMTGSDLHPALLERMGRAVLASRAVLDSAGVADELIGEDLAAGRLTLDEARKTRTAEAYTAGVVRAFAGLASLGAVTDLGDFPPHCAVKPGELLGRTPLAAVRHVEDGGDVDDVEDRVVTAVLALPVRAAASALRRQKLNVTRLDAHLAGTVPQYRSIAEDPASTWQLLADLHDRGLLDVSAAPSRRLVTGVAVHAHSLPREFLSIVSGRAVRAADEIRLLRDFFTDSTTCANRKFADYFGVADLPAGCCSTAANRCSAHWNTPTWPAGETKPAVAVALETPRPASTRTNAAHRLRRLDEQIFRLVWEVFRGVHARDLLRALRGEDTYFDPRTRRRVRLRTGLITSRYFGVNPAVRLIDVEDSLARLQADERIVPAGTLWREAGHVRREARQQARAAALVPTTTGGAS